MQCRRGECAWVMNTRGIVIALAPGLLIGSFLYMSTIARQPPVRSRLVRVEPIAIPETKAVTIELTRLNTTDERTSVWLTHKMTIQLRIKNRWEAPQALSQPSKMLDTAPEYIIVGVPAQTQALRLSGQCQICYKARNPYCKAYATLSRMGLLRRFPKLSRTILNFYGVSPKPVLLEIRLPEEQPAQNSAARAAERGLSNSVQSE